MRRLTAMLSGTAVLLMAAGLAAQAKPSFAGEWKMMANPDAGGGRGGRPGADLIITQDAASMTVDYPKAPAAMKLTCKLDGSESKNMMAGRGGAAPTEQVSKAMWSGNTLIVTTTTGAGEEKRTFSTDGGYLVVETSARARNGGAQNVTRETYKKYERGFGG